MPTLASVTALLGDPTQEPVAGRELEGSLSLSESFTPDHKPLMGEAPELRGFFLGCGFNSAGEWAASPPPPPAPNIPLREGGLASPLGWGAGSRGTGAPDRGGDGPGLQEGVRSQRERHVDPSMTRRAEGLMLPLGLGRAGTGVRGPGGWFADPWLRSCQA